MVEILRPGFAPALVPYHEGWDLQRRLHREIADGVRGDALLLLEHESVYTAGKLTDDHERPRDGTPVVDIDRGGKITWHGPGQLVGYPIVTLPRPVDVVAYVRRLEELLIAVLEPLGIEGRRVEGRTGVWVQGAFGDEKIAAIGVRVQRAVTMHGFALNCSNSVDAFGEIIPCGITDAGVTSISAVLGRTVEPADVADSVVDTFQRMWQEVPA